MRFGLLLPLIGWPGRDPDPRLVLELAARAEDAGFSVLCANDHLVYARPWLDGPSALAAAAARTTRIRLMLVGPEQKIVDQVAACADAGVDELVLWPVIDELRQLETFASRIAPQFAEDR